MGEASRRKKVGVYPEKTTKTTPVSNHCLDWKVVGGLTDHAEGAKLIEALVSLRETLNPSLGGNTMAVLLETTKGKPVLTAYATGMAAWMSLIAEFQKLGLKDRLENLNDPVDGFDAIFS